MLVQKMVPKGRETILGMTRDPHFGPLLMFGLGGTLWRCSVTSVSVWRLSPRIRALKMIQGLKGFRILKSFRGDPPADLAAIVASLERLSQMVLDFAELKELDINPFMVFDEGQGAAVVDARIFIS